MIQKEVHVFKGMNRDNNPMNIDPSLAYEIRNMRITVDKDNNSLFLLTNERGPNNLNIKILGYYLGHAVLNNYLVVFSTKGTVASNDKYDYIQVFEYKGTTINNIGVLTDGTTDLGFDINHPIETLVIYENEKLQKVYWVDGINQPRVVNLVDKKGNIKIGWIKNNNKTLLDFATKIDLNHTCSINKSNVGGTFPTGTIQYAFSYFNYGMQESNLFEISPLYYLSRKDRGDLTTELQSCSFSIKLNNLDSNYNYVRCYAIIRTSKNATPVCRIVGDYPINNKSISIYDTGAEGSTIDATKLLFIGATDFIAGTLTQKDNTLFLGNIRKNNKDLNVSWKNFQLDRVLIDYDGDKVFDIGNGGVSFKKTTDKETLTSPTEIDTFYKYTPNNNRPSTAVKRFKSREYYKYGFIGQYTDGSFTNVIPLGIFQPESGPRFQYRDFNDEVVEDESLFLPDNKDDCKNMKPCVLTESFRCLLFGKKLIQSLKDKGIKKLYPVVVYPTEEYRSVITQGFISPTVFKIAERYDDMPFVESSWIYRFFSNDKDDLVVPSAYHLGSLYPSVNPHAELSNVLWGTGTGKYDRILSPIAKNNDNKNDFLTSSKYKSTFGQEYLQDCHVLTLNSPETELGLLDNTNLENLSFRIVGFSSFIKHTITQNDEHIKDDDYDTALESVLSHSWIYAELDAINTKSVNTSIRAVIKDSKKNALPCFSYSQNTDSDINAYIYYYFMDPKFSYGWGMGTGDLVLNKSIKSNLRCGYTTYNVNCRNAEYKNTYPQLFNSKEIQPLKIKYDDTFSSVLYYGNYNSLKNRQLIKKDAYLIYNSQQNDNKFSLLGIAAKDDKGYKSTLSASQYVYFRSPLSSVDSKDLTFEIECPTENTSANSPIEIKYKSTPHIIFSLPTSNGFQEVLATRDFMYNPSDDIQLPFWYKDLEGEYKTKPLTIDANSDTEIGFKTPILTKDQKIYYAGLFIGEFYRNSEDIGFKEGITRYSDYMGGIEYEPYLNWVICGDAVIIKENDNDIPHINYYDNGWKTDTDETPPFANKLDNDTYNGAYELIYKEGDVYVGRYDSLKTYPFDESTGNGIIEIYSSELESRINLDERVDRNRGLIDNTIVRPYSNFNIFNDTAYNQDNNYFPYKTNNENQLTVENFPNQITWSLEKTMGEDIDTWTQITLTSIMDLDGDKGELNYLTTFNNNIIAFQDKGISQILFNSRVQIPTSDNNPIEITNGYKVDGKRYISETIGCQNKWSIVTGDNGIYFIDDNRKTAYVFGQQLQPLSYTLGMQSYFNRFTFNTKWKPVGNVYNQNTTRCFYDKKNKEVYYVHRYNTNDTQIDISETLLYSEITNSFTSLLDYNNIMLMENFDDAQFIMYNQTLYEMFKGEYNKFPSGVKPFYVEFYSNAQNSPEHKIFANIEWHSNLFSQKNLLINDWNNIHENLTWDMLYINNPYQSSNHYLYFAKNNRMNTLEKKFDIWRSYFPRTINSRNRNERIAHQYAKIKLEMSNPKLNINIDTTNSNSYNKQITYIDSNGNNIVNTNFKFEMFDTIVHSQI